MFYICAFDQIFKKAFKFHICRHRDKNRLSFLVSYIFQHYDVNL